MNKYLFFRILAILSSLAMLAGCASVTPVQPGAENIKITKKPISRNCQWRGKVLAVNDDRSMNTPYQHTTLEKEEFNKLRNQAFKLRANMIVLSPSSGMTDKKHWASKAQHSAQADHVYSGNAYWCPAN